MWSCSRLLHDRKTPYFLLRTDGNGHKFQTTPKDDTSMNQAGPLSFNFALGLHKYVQTR